MRVKVDSVYYSCVNFCSFWGLFEIGHPAPSRFSSLVTTHVVGSGCLFAVTNCWKTAVAAVVIVVYQVSVCPAVAALICRDLSFFAFLSAFFFELLFEFFDFCVFERHLLC